MLFLSDFVRAMVLVPMFLVCTLSLMLQVIRSYPLLYLLMLISFLSLLSGLGSLLLFVSVSMIIATVKLGSIVTCVCSYGQF